MDEDLKKLADNFAEEIFGHQEDKQDYLTYKKHNLKNELYRIVDYYSAVIDNHIKNISNEKQEI